jgi:SAM-dependent methyltransferase
MDIITSLHKSTKRDYLERMSNDKIACMEIASRFEFDYWDGERKYGFGGYQYDGRWESVAKKLIDNYGLSNSSSVLDIGCGKAHLIYEIQQKLPGIKIVGLDISKHAKESTLDGIRDSIEIFDCRTKLDFSDIEFDLVISLNTIHNFSLSEVELSLSEMHRVSKKQYVVVESYRNDTELFNLQCWALTCKSFYSPKDWNYLLDKNCPEADYEFIYFE